MDYVNTAALEFITGKRDLDADWDAYVKDCENKGSQKYVDEANEIYKDTKDLLWKIIFTEIIFEKIQRIWQHLLPGFGTQKEKSEDMKFWHDTKKSGRRKYDDSRIFKKAEYYVYCTWRMWKWNTEDC